MAYRTLTNGCGASIFQPSYQVFELQKTLHKVDFDVSLMELNKVKKEDKKAVGSKEKVSIP